MPFCWTDWMGRRQNGKNTNPSVENGSHSPSSKSSSVHLCSVLPRVETTMRECDASALKKISRASEALFRHWDTSPVFLGSLVAFSCLSPTTDGFATRNDQFNDPPAYRTNEMQTGRYAGFHGIKCPLHVAKPRSPQRRRADCGLRGGMSTIAPKR